MHDAACVRVLHGVADTSDHLQPLSQRWLCSLDAGDNTRVAASLTLDYLGNPRFADDLDTIDTGIGASPIVDFGAIERPGSACAADYNGDGLGDILDLLDFLDEFAGCEGQAGPCGSISNVDFNGDTIVDMLDFLDFLDAFSSGC